jgi:hypothetical protein
MGNLSVVLNIFTIILVGTFFYITFLAYNNRVNKNEVWLGTFKRVFSGEQELNKALASNVVAPVSFIGQDWSETPCNESLFGKGIGSVDIVDADNQDSLVDFMDTSSATKYGTDSVASKQQRSAFASMSLAQQQATASSLTGGFVSTQATRT